MEKGKLLYRLEIFFWGMTAVGLPVMMRLYGRLGVGAWCLVLLIALTAFGIHVHRMKTPDYWKKTLGIQSEKKRMYEYDWLRTLAVVMVIITHGIQADLAGDMISGERAQYLMTVTYMFCLACNLIYVMLSGALLIPYKEEKLSDFYIHRVSRVVLPMVIYYVVYKRINLELEQVTFQTVKDIFLELFSGDTPGTPHYWLMYVILGIYIVIPFLRYMFRDMPYRLVTAMAALSWLFMLLQICIPVKCAVNPILSSWIGVAVTGYWVTRKETRKYDGWIMTSGCAGFAVTMYVIRTKENFMPLCCNCSPMMLMIACGLFSAVFAFPKIFSKGNWILCVVSKYSYSVILIHWTILFVLTEGVFKIYTNEFYCVGGIFLSLAVTLAISLLYGFVIDNTLLIVVELVYDTAVTYIRVLYRNKKEQRSRKQEGGKV